MLRTLGLALSTAACLALGTPVALSHAQWYPAGYPPPLPAPTSAPSDDPAAACQRQILQAAYPFAVQLLQYAHAFQAWPMGPNGRPLLAPAPYQYPGFAGTIYHPWGSPGYNLANYYGFQNLSGLPLVAGAFSPFITGETPYADLVANIFSADSHRLGYVDSRIAAAELNTAFTLFPLEVTAGLKDVLDALVVYGELACPAPANGH